jgi:hypothetical protein
MLNDFEDDGPHVSIYHLVSLASRHIGTVSQLYRITYNTTASRTTHYIAYVNEGRVLCDCLMQINGGIPCRHFFALLRQPEQLVTFHLSLYNPR